MTNFEKWRDSLTPEEAAVLNARSYRVKQNCFECPVRGCSQSTYTHCAKSFLRWANAPAEEEK